MKRYCRRMAQVIFALLLGSAVFAMVMALWPDESVVVVAYGMIVCFGSGWMCAHGHECEA